MKRSRFSEEQIVGVLKEAEAGVPVKDLCRRVGISDATFYHWKAKYGGLEVSETRRLRQLEEENGRLKKIVAPRELALPAKRTERSRVASSAARVGSRSSTIRLSAVVHFPATGEDRGRNASVAGQPQASVSAVPGGRAGDAA